MVDRPAVTAAELETAICNALEAGDIEATITLVHHLARVDPRRAAEVLEAIRAGLALAGL